MRFIISLTVATLSLTLAEAQDTTGAKKAAPSVSKAKSTSKGKSSAAASKQTKPAGAKPQAASTTAANKTAVHRKSTSKTAGKSTAKKQAVVARRWAQQQPSTQRYKEIQEALSERGYFHGEPDGTWGPESIESLKRFQQDQSLTVDGKIGSLSLIALGLGPRRSAPEPAPERTQNQ